MAVFLFWNVNGRDLRNLVCDATRAVAADVVILVENCETVPDTLEMLRRSVSPTFECPAATLGRFQLYTRNPDLDLSQVYSANRLSLRRLRISSSNLLFGIVHVVDKLNWGPFHQAGEVQLLSAELRKEEDKAGHSRTILMGDFNMNPFDQVMNLATGMNAMMTTQCTMGKDRHQQGNDYRFFYNPMWSCFGDRTPGPAGTFYHTSRTQGIFGWNMLDQALIRPDALHWFDNVEILTSAGATSLLTRQGRPSPSIGSDHFPLILRLR